MKTIKQDELFKTLGDFLKTRGIELKDGEYAQRIRRGCDLLTGIINATEKTVRRAKTETDKKLDQLRQCIHEATAPKRPPVMPTPHPAVAKSTRRPAAKPRRRRPAKPSKPAQ